LIFTPPHEIVLIVRQAVIAVTLTPVRRKRHMQFVTSAQNFRGSADPSPLIRLSRAPAIIMITMIITDGQVG